MGHVIFALDTVQFIKINDVHGNLKDWMKLDLCSCDALCYMLDTMETRFVGMTIN